jgi:hypothetical protein
MRHSTGAMRAPILAGVTRPSDRKRNHFTAGRLDQVVSYLRDQALAAQKDAVDATAL